MTRVPTPDPIHLEDARRFLSLYELLTASPPPPGQRKNLRQVIQIHGEVLGDKYTTLLGRLTRVYDHVWPGRPDWMGSGVNELFREDTPGEGVRPTRKAEVLYKHLKNLVASHDRLLPAVRSELTAAPDNPAVRVGSSHSIALRVLSAAFASWREVFDGVLDLDLQIANGSDVMAQLNASLLDLVVSYGPPRSAEYALPGESRVLYAPLWKVGGVGATPAFLSRFVVICHPRHRMAMKDNSDPNAGYWEATYRDPRAGKNSARQRAVIPRYDDLRAIRLDDIDTSAVEFVRVTTWNPPREMLEFFERFQGRNRVVNWHEEALAFARTGQAAAIVSEGTARRRGITAFRILPEDPFTRAIGVYTRADGTRGRAEVRLLIRFLEQYVGRFEDAIRDIKAPRYGDDQYRAFLDEFRSESMRRE